ncbi:photosystem reaction center subunit H [Candidatus Woesearchaeota archaeon]|jgi:sporulation protein YlmC with PRC-barrel domain|nr:photosystem reaction center subunit H [Candidatus Woesearchaeota archaeon]MBT5343071.1 photosystem reaction center subunit H [Candidatus Woesearchaeota archaeon]MBT5739816.1 photosystem reaction center subunit H [Candidatus Woesearchaeota archaeon]
MLKMKKVSETYDLKVFTDTGEYFGDVEDSIIQTNKVSGWKIKSTKNSFLSRVIGSAKGVIVPHQLVKAVGDILIISKSAVPTGAMDDEEPSAE